MYEDIDEIELPNESVDDAGLARRRFWLGGVIILGFAVLIAAAFLTAKAPIIAAVDVEAVKAEQAAYRAALTDPEPAMRRARLKDFLSAYPESARVLAAKAQMSVLDAREADDWAALTHIIYDTDALKVEKEAALHLFESRWNSALVGGRETELKRIRERVAAEPDDGIAPGLLDNPDDFPEAIPSDEMLGGTDRRTDMYIRSQYENSGGAGDNAYRGTVEPPRVRRNVQPRYPRKARRRGVEAQIVLRLYIDDRGRVEMTELISARADRYEDDFIDAAEYAALRTRFYPQTINGEPVPTSNVEKRYRFQMED